MRFRAWRRGAYNDFVYTWFKALTEERLQYAEGYYIEQGPEAGTIEMCGYDVQKRCPHMKADLSRFGVCEDGILTCHQHGWQWELATGRCLTSAGHELSGHAHRRPRRRRCRRSHPGLMQFRATILQTGRNTAGIQVPPGVIEALGAGKRPPVTVTVNGFTYRTTVAVMGGDYWVGSERGAPGRGGSRRGRRDGYGHRARHRPARTGDPGGLRGGALDVEPAARKTFEALSYSNKSWHTLQIEGAKTDETRQRRIARSIEILKEGRPR